MACVQKKSLKSESYTSANSKFTTTFLEIQYFSPSGIYIIKFASIFIFLPFKYIPLIRGSQLGVISPPRAHLAMSRDISVVTTVYGGVLFTCRRQSPRMQSLNILQIHSVAPTMKNYLIQNVNSAEGKKPCSKSSQRSPSYDQGTTFLV